MQNIRYAFILAALTLYCGIVAADPAMTESGAALGSHEQGLSIYKGIPFASAPVGALRWREPLPAKAWQGVRKALAFAPACMQTGVSMPGEDPPAVSEDCLFLNIWTPATRPKAQAGLPVLVWIYGGAYSNGSASMPLYHGDRLAQQGIIVVTIAYRLGPLGYLAHPELTRESAHGSSGNYGLMDQIAALRWVQRNIAAFGGDPEKVTVAGQSAGAMSVSELMASPQAKGLFQRAIGQSGGLFEPWQLAPGYVLANAEKDGVKYAESRGVATLQELRRLPAAELIRGDVRAVSHPVLDPYVLPLSPYDAFSRGLQNDVPLLLGSNTEEARSLIDVSAVKAATFAAGLEQSVGPLPPPLLAAYPYHTDPEARQARLDLETALRFGWDMWAWARLQVKTGKHPVYYYAFDQHPPFPAGSPYAGWGPSHFAELWYMFNHLDQQTWRWTRADRKLARDMSAYWVNFAKSGNPNGKGLAQWPAYAGTDGRVLHFGDPSIIGGVPGIRGLEVFDAVYQSVRGKEE
ncbi:carboxylesterase/lipase family protein [Undibacterium sp. TJN25]|uniref:carboxylesterase/lipase family protein n=1 Tax=Undibacterium sp. TJN25 TaxID=3413056 RepID=UPI003BF26262